MESTDPNVAVAETDGAKAVTSDQLFRLSPLQQGMLFHELASDISGVHIEQIVCRINEPVDQSLMNKAWQLVIDHFPSLRSEFDWEQRSHPIQRFRASLSVPLAFHDWRSRHESDQESDLQEFLNADRKKGVRLDHAPLMRVSLIELNGQRWVMVWTFHHALIDGRSFPVVLEAVFNAYQALKAGQTPALEPAPHYVEYLKWLESRDSDGDQKFWRSLLKDFTEPVSLKSFEQRDGGDDPVRRRERRISLDAGLSERIRKQAQDGGVTVNTLVQFAWALMLSRYSGASDIVFGAVRAGRHSTIDGAANMVGLFINTLPVRIGLDGDRPVRDCLEDLRNQSVAVRPYEQTSLANIQSWSQVPPGTTLFDSIIVFDREHLNTSVHHRVDIDAEFELFEQTSYPLTLYVYAEEEIVLRLSYDSGPVGTGAASAILDSLQTILDLVAADPSVRISELETLSELQRQRLIKDLNETSVRYDPQDTLCRQFETRARENPDAPAVAFKDQELTYGELNRQAEMLASRLRSEGVVPNQPVGICLERSLEMLVGMLAVLKSGGAYLPLDPHYPSKRLDFILSDSGASLVLANRTSASSLPRERVKVIELDGLLGLETTAPAETTADPDGDHLAYIIYTSGSTGDPKGVMVTHRNVTNFFTGMDDRISYAPGDVFLAVTSISFDISVLELFWTLTRGLKLVIQPDDDRTAATDLVGVSSVDRPLDFGVFFFAAGDDGPSSNKYRLLLETAKVADSNGFTSIWTPERHFHGFGGIYPSPAVVGAAIAAITENIQIRAGSVVLPLRDPIRVAEEWSVVDNLSNGRVGVSFASGWHANDFVLQPHRYEDRKAIMFDDLEVVQKLWRGESIKRVDGAGTEIEVGILPRPIQDRLPVWITAAGAPETFAEAGKAGANVLTHLLGQDLDAVQDRITAYRQAWHENGHGPDEGKVTIMLHTFVGEDLDEVREVIRQPLLDYLRTSSGLVRSLTKSLGLGDEETMLTDEDMELLWDKAFDRFFRGGGLLGTRDSCIELVDRLKMIGVDEVACLIDFGVDTDVILENMPHLVALKEAANPLRPADEDGVDWTIAANIRRHGVTHIQSTPSLASLLIPLAEARDALSSLKCFLVGGEALPVQLARDLKSTVAGQVVNMYGPTETTIWSSTYEVTGEEESMPIGRPIANTQLYVLDQNRHLVPEGAVGELYIGGDGVTDGYWQRDSLTSDRFVDDPYGQARNRPMYRTGDLVRVLRDGNIEFRGRADFQVKLRGFRIELGEIEAVLARVPGISKGVAVVREDSHGEQQLVAYLVAEDSDPDIESRTMEQLREWLPAHMVPNAVVTLGALPLTPNGKIDRNALPAPGRARRASEEPYAPPESDFEKKIADIWAEVLNLDSVGLNDNFFDLGGHSLHMVSVLTKLRSQVQAKVEIVDLFRYPTVQSLADRLSAGDDGEQLEKSRQRSVGRRASLKKRAAQRRRRKAPAEG